MEKEFEIIKQLSPEEKKEFDRDIQQIYFECHKALNGKMHRLKDVVTNINLQNKVFLRVTIEYDNTISETVKGRITDLHKYVNRKEYNIALAIERKDLN